MIGFGLTATHNQQIIIMDYGLLSYKGDSIERKWGDKLTRIKSTFCIIQLQCRIFGCYNPSKGRGCSDLDDHIRNQQEQHNSTFYDFK